MTLLQGILSILLGMLLLLGLCWGLLCWNKHAEKEYDERQSIERGNAYKISFWIGIVYYMVVVTLGAFDGSTDTLHLLVMLGVLIQVFAFFFCCLLTDAELPLSRKPGVAIASDFLFAAWFLVDVFWRGVSLGTKVSELVSFDWLNLLCGLGFMMMGLMQLVQLLRNREE